MLSTGSGSGVASELRDRYLNSAGLFVRFVNDNQGYPTAARVFFDKLVTIRLESLRVVQRV